MNETEDMITLQMGDGNLIQAERKNLMAHCGYFAEILGVPEKDPVRISDKVTTEAAMYLLTRMSEWGNISPSHVALEKIRGETNDAVFAEDVLMALCQWDLIRFPVTEHFIGYLAENITLENCCRLYNLNCVEPHLYENFVFDFSDRPFDVAVAYFINEHMDEVIAQKKHRVMEFNAVDKFLGGKDIIGNRGYVCVKEEAMRLKFVCTWVMLDFEGHKGFINLLLRSISFAMISVDDLDRFKSRWKKIYEYKGSINEWKSDLEAAYEYHNMKEKRPWHPLCREIALCHGYGERPILFGLPFSKLTDSVLQNVNPECLEPYHADFPKCDLLVNIGITEEIDYFTEWEWDLDVYADESRWVVMKKDNPFFLGAASCEFNNFLFVCGGSIGGAPRYVTRRCFLFDPRVLAWTELKPLPSPRTGHALVQFDGALYAIGGMYETCDCAPLTWTTGPRPAYGCREPDEHWHKYLDCVDRYDPASGSWCCYDDLPLPLVYPAAMLNLREKTKVGAGGILVFGGDARLKGRHHLFRYKPDEKEFTKLLTFNLTTFIHEPYLCYTEPCTSEIMIVDQYRGTVYIWEEAEDGISVWKRSTGLQYRTNAAGLVTFPLGATLTGYQTRESKLHAVNGWMLRSEVDMDAPRPIIDIGDHKYVPLSLTFGAESGADIRGCDVASENVPPIATFPPGYFTPLAALMVIPPHLIAPFYNQEHADGPEDKTFMMLTIPKKQKT